MLIWHYTWKGKFTLNSAYYLDLVSVNEELQTGSSGDGRKVDWFWKMLWQLKIPTKIKVFAWKCCLEILPVKAQLMKKKVSVNGHECEVCGGGLESVRHCFQECDFAEIVWMEAGLHAVWREDVDCLEERAALRAIKFALELGDSATIRIVWMETLCVEKCNQLISTKRINLAKLKAQIVKKLGPEGSKQYFYCLNRFLSLKLSRVEFNKLCIRIVGRENILLHNQFVHSILKNACSAKVPPLIYDKEVQESVRPVGNKEHSEGHKQSVSGLSNGYILPSSPRKARTGTRDRKASDCPSAQEPNGKANFVSRQLLTEQDSKFNVSLENGDLTQHDIERLVHHHQGVTEQANNEGEVLHHLSSNFLTIKRLPDDSTSIHSKDQIETVDFENRKEVPYRSELCAPLGVPSCPVSVGGARKTIPVASSSNCSSSFTSGCLLDTATLRERMEQIAAAQGLEGGMSQRRAVPTSTRRIRSLLMVSSQMITFHSGNRLMEIMQERTPHRTTSLLDFRVAMELNPQQLGEDWPLLLEKICTQSFEE
ncbi:hypothetical protein Acr_26g0005590 [Actinidia rufa]|uniref:Reverse transcriptase zinc-binding domain-containing protein n=1 Tax=Actinidia rufa TaxID=165716 RepID=A0A7J0H2L1_9ERIC|nr:hypothetical protein Acr_26g0005590 [Actinidia rufa]